MSTCVECSYYTESPTTPYAGAGLCRRYPPAPVPSALGAWTVVKGTDWCGEYLMAPAVPTTDGCLAYALDPASMTEACTCGHMPQDHAGATGACAAVLA